MKRKLSTSDNDDQEESRLSNLLFTKPQDFAEKLKPGHKDDFLHIDLKPAWIDEDDELFDANIVPDSKTKGLYKDTLKHKYEALIGTPNWARLDRVIDDSKEDKALRSVGHLQKIHSETLPKDILELQKFHDIKLAGNKQIITCVAFHPTASVLLIGSRKGKVSLYSVSGDDNNLLHSFILKDPFIPIRAFFTPEGSEVYIGSRSGRYYCVYNLVKAEPKLVYLPDALKKSVLFEMSPDGKLLAASDGFDEVFLISTLGKELIRVLKHNNEIEAVTFSSDSGRLYSYSKQGEVSIWNMSTYRVIKKFQDHGCVTASSIVTSPCGRLLATGTGEGIVNIYELSNLDSSAPLPLKTIEHLKTKITHMKFNPGTEILSISSSYYPNAVKLVHIPSYHVFQNFPEISVNIFQVESLGFSPNCGYMALGNNRGCVFLYRLKHYKNY